LASDIALGVHVTYTNSGAKNTSSRTETASNTPVRQQEEEVPFNRVIESLKRELKAKENLLLQRKLQIDSLQQQLRAREIELSTASKQNFLRRGVDSASMSVSARSHNTTLLNTRSNERVGSTCGLNAGYEYGKSRMDEAESFIDSLFPVSTHKTSRKLGSNLDITAGDQNGSLLPKSPSKRNSLISKGVVRGQAMDAYFTNVNSHQDSFFTL
jgi:hypothetical protein